MKNLRRIYLQQNQLTRVVTLAGLYTLVFIDLSYNRISHVPAFWLDGFRHLQVMPIKTCIAFRYYSRQKHNESSLCFLTVKFRGVQSVLSMTQDASWVK